MGRYKAMQPAENSTGPLPQASASEAVPDRVRKLTVRTLRDRDRYEDLKEVSIAKPAGPLRSQAIDRAALVQAHTPVIDAGSDRKKTRTIARFLYEEALTAGYVDEQRALTRESVDRWLFGAKNLSPHSASTYRVVLYAAGRTLYPREFPAPLRVLTGRSKITPAAVPGTAEELYATATVVPEILRPRLLLVLDLITGAGLRSQEVREITGSDVSVVKLPYGREVTVLRIRRRGKVDRIVPVTCPRKGHRLLMRAAEVGTGTLYQLTANQVVSRNAVSKLSDRLREYGYAGLDAVALRNRWILDMAMTPGIPTAAVLKLAGVGDLRVLADQAHMLPDYSAEQLTEILLAAEGRLS